MSIDTQSVVTPYDQETNYETGRIMGQVDYRIGITYPRTPWGIFADDAAACQGYERGWIEAEEEECLEALTNSPATDEEAQFELELEYQEAMWS